MILQDLTVAIAIPFETTQSHTIYYVQPIDMISWNCMDLLVDVGMHFAHK